MTDHIVGIEAFNHLKVLFVGILMYAIIYSLLKKVDVLGHDDKINSLVALLAAIIVSFSGVVTYAVAYAINWFAIIFFIIFLLMTLLLFLGVKMDDVNKQIKENGKVIVWTFFGLFAIILIKGFFGLSNAFDTSNPPESPYDVDTSFNTGIGDITGEDDNEYEVEFGEFNFDSELIQAALFLAVIGIFVLLIGREKK